MTAEIVNLRQSAPLTDVPGKLRELADAIEAGEHGDVSGLFAIMPRDQDYPTIFGWGDVCGANEPITQLELAKLWLLTRATSR